MPDMAKHWTAYSPDGTAPWSLRRVVHLHRRASFAATWAEIQRDLKDGPQVAIDRLLAGKSATHTPPEFAATADLLADAAVTSGEPGRLKAWWVYRMMFGPDPLGEKLTLLWHDHFATSNAKVNDLSAMRRQNDTFRKFARAPFGELLKASVREPALLAFLDAPANRKGHANENLARELMELFTLGIGNYTEGDVKEAARALTGWTVTDGNFQENPSAHDAGEKTILGKKGPWKGADLVKMLLEHPATSERLAKKLGRLFFGEKGVQVDAVKTLAEGLREHSLNLGWAVETVLRSKAFFDESNMGTKILGPVDYVLGTARALELFDPAPSTLALADWCGRLGQDLFEPPNVGGWPAGKAWVSARTLIGRANFVTALLDGPNAGRPTPLDAAELCRRYGGGELTEFFARLLFGTDPTPSLRERVGAAEGRKVVSVLLAAPEAQLG
ncbi:MAG: DUF1800 family protein [Gemmataceae bacterium]